MQRLSENNQPFLFEDDMAQYRSTDILSALQKIGVRCGQFLFVHSQLSPFGKIQSSMTRHHFMEGFLGALKDAVSDGHLMMPTFTYSFCRNEIYNPLKTPSTVGVLTEHFRLTQPVSRSLDPIFSIAVLGPNQAVLADVGSDCFGDRSVFDKLYQMNATLLFLGNRFDITFMHYVEQKIQVPYRHFKTFEGFIQIGETLKQTNCRYYVRSLKQDVSYDLEKIASYLQEAGVLKQIKLGNSKMRAVSARDAFSVLSDRLKENISCLLTEESMKRL